MSVLRNHFTTMNPGISGGGDLLPIEAWKKMINSLFYTTGESQKASKECYFSANFIYI
jgi:hypothetical protein